MSEQRTTKLEEILAADPHDTRARFGLALEYLKTGRLEEGVEQLRAYLKEANDEGNAWGRLGDALFELGRVDEAKEAYRRGIEAALGHGHPTMAEEFARILEDRL